MCRVRDWHYVNLYKERVDNLRVELRLFIRTNNEWNKLSESVLMAPPVKVFERHLDHHNTDRLHSPWSCTCA